MSDSSEKLITMYRTALCHIQYTVTDTPAARQLLDASSNGRTKEMFPTRSVPRGFNWEDLLEGNPGGI
jgi:hypothetical protein